MPLRVRLEEREEERPVSDAYSQPKRDALVVEEPPVALNTAELDPLPLLVGELHSQARQHPHRTSI